MAHLPRCPEHLSVVPVGKQATGAPKRSVHLLAHADAEAPDSLLERGWAVGLDEEVHMAVLDREGHDAEVLESSMQLSEHLIHCLAHGGGPEVPAFHCQPQREVHRVAGLHGRPTLMGVASQLPRLAAGTLATPTPAVWKREVELSGFPATHAF
jgi:hypothetical protein